MRKKAKRSIEAASKGSGPQIVKVGNVEMVIMPRETWELTLEQLEDLEDIRAYKEAKARHHEKTIAHDEVCRRLGLCPLRYLRNLAGMTQQTLAKKSRLSQSYIAKVESGEREITLASAKKLAGVLGRSADELLPR